MIVCLHDQLRNPTRVSATTVVIRDSDENPMAVAVETAIGIYVYKATDKGFKEALKQLGITDTVVVEILELNPVE